MSAVGPEWGAVASGWTFALGPTVLLASAAAGYAAGVARVTRRRPGGGWPRRRSAAFAAGVAALAVALLSGLDARAELELSTHMVQHLLITTVAAPLIAAGAPLSLALQASTGETRRRLSAAVRSRAVRTITAPAVALGIFAAVTLATHLTGFYDAAVRQPLLHGVEHLLYLSTAVLFWLPVVGTNPLPQLRSFAGRTVYLFVSMPVMAAVGVVLTSSASVRYPAYASAAPAAGVDPLLDQQAAGALMWVGGTVILTVLLIVVAFQAMLAEERRQQALDGLERAAGART